MAFPVEGWSGSAAVAVCQATKDDPVEVTVYGQADAEKAKAQALAALSLDEDGGEWGAVGKADSVVLDLQKKISLLTPEFVQ